MDFITYIFINSSHYLSKLNSQSKNTFTSTINIYLYFFWPCGMPDFDYDPDSHGL